MSVEVISWALNLAPVPADRGRQPSSACKFVLVGLANHTRAGRNRRIPVGGHLGSLYRPVGAHHAHLPGPLEAASIISLCDPDIVAARMAAGWRAACIWTRFINCSVTGETADRLHRRPRRQARITDG